MMENNNAPVPEENKPDPATPEGDLRAELARVRGRNKTLKILAAVLLSCFLVIAAGGYYIYRKVTTAMAPFQEAFEGFAPPSQGYQPENRTLPMSRGVFSSTSMPASTLGLLTGGIPDASPVGNMDAEQAERIYNALNKYSNRPIVKAIMADLKKNPDMAKAFAASKDDNPLKVLALVQNTLPGPNS